MWVSLQWILGRFDQAALDFSEPVPWGFKPTVRSILQHNKNWTKFLLSRRDNYTSWQIEAVEDLLACGDTFRAETVFECENCHYVLSVPYTCRGRSCSRCGKQYADEWGDRFARRYFKVPHRHFIFTLPQQLYPIIQHDTTWKLHQAMLDAAVETMQQMFDNRFGAGRVIPGMVSVVHVIGRDLKFNPHIHMIITEGGIDRQRRRRWRKNTFWKYSILDGLWQKNVMRHFRLLIPRGPDTWELLDRMEHHRFKDGHRGFIVKDVAKDGIPAVGLKSLGRYLARYLRHPPIGDSRILDYDGDQIQIKWEWDGRMHTSWVPVTRLIEALLENVPPKGVQIVRSYGIYANNLRKWVLSRMQVLGLAFNLGGRWGQKSLIPGPYCPKCNIPMQFIYSRYTSRKGVVKQYERRGGSPLPSTEDQQLLVSVDSLG